MELATVVLNIFVSVLIAMIGFSFLVFVYLTHKKVGIWIYAKFKESEEKLGSNLYYLGCVIFFGAIGWSVMILILYAYFLALTKIWGF